MVHLESKLKKLFMCTPIRRYEKRLEAQREGKEKRTKEETSVRKQAHPNTQFCAKDATNRSISKLASLAAQALPVD